MYKKLKLFLFALAVIPGFIFAQTVHQVDEGTDVLKAAIDAAVSGDIIELVTDGGSYLSTEQINIDKSLIIRGHADLINKPVIKYTGASGPNTLFQIGGNPRVEFRNLDIDGNGDGGPVTNILRLDNADFVAEDSTMEVVIDDCKIHGTAQKLIRPYSNSNIDSMLINNSIFFDALQEGVMLSSGGSADPPVYLDYAEITNCTFYNITREAIKAQSNPDTKALIDHCTFYNIGGLDKPFIFINTSTDVVIKNSIFEKNLETGNFLRLAANENIVNNIIFWDVFDHDIENTDSVTDTLFADPLFTDPDNADFTLMEISQAIGFADDGNAAGDPRWDPTIGQPQVHKVSAGENTLYDAIQAAVSGDIIELTDNGGDYVYTLDSDKIEVDKVLTIRAREGLTQKPIIRNRRPGGSTSMRNFEVLSGGSLTLIGLEFDGSGDGSGVAMAKQAIRLNAGDSSNVFLKIYDCYFHDYTENFLRGYRLTVVDTFIIQNSICTRSVREGLMLYDTSSDGPALNYALFENTTFTKIGREAIKIGSAAVGYNPEVVINHVTMDSISTGGDYRMIRMNAGTIPVANVTIKNSILSNQMGGYAYSTSLYGTSTISYSDTFNVRTAQLNESAAFGDGILGVDPMYNNPADSDYRLATNSPVRAMADDGLAMGDLRWQADPGTFYLTIETEGNGIVTLDPANGPYAPGTQVTATAVPDLGWAFDIWEGNVFPPNANPVTITMNKDETLKATFLSLTPQVTVTVDTIGLGYVTVLPEPKKGTYDQGTNVTLTAVPRANWEFVEWLGDISGTENPKTFAADSNMNVTASFQSTLTQFSLTVNIVGEGSVSQLPEPVISTYDTATVVELTANPVLGWDFAGWSGALTGTVNPVNVKMDSNITITATFIETQYTSNSLEIDDSWDLKDAVDLANNNSIIDTLVLISSGGLYTSVNTSDVAVLKPLTIIAKDGLAEKPVLTNSDSEGANLDIFRIFDDFTLKGVLLDGGHESSHGMKYGIRLAHYSGGDSVKVGTNITVTDCDFKDFFDKKNPLGDGHAYKQDIDIVAGDVYFENCTFTNFGYEAFRISETEKYVTEKALESLTIRNCTFTNIDAEAVRYYSDVNPTTPDAPVILEHITINNSATRVFFLKNSGGAIVRDIIVANSRTSGHGRDADIMEIQGATSTISYIDTFNVKSVPIVASKDASLDSATVYGFDPQFVDADNLDYTLTEGSPAYGKGHDGEALGDLRWAKFPTALLDEEGQIPAKFSLSQNYPNPFNPSTTIQFGLSEAGKTKLVIYNVLGKEVAVLVNKELVAGSYKFVFYHPDLATGVYFYRLTSGKNTSIKKMLLVK